jgi:hypothetical protein
VLLHLFKISQWTFKSTPIGKKSPNLVTLFIFKSAVVSYYCALCSILYIDEVTTNWRGRLNTVELLIKVVCKKVNNACIIRNNWSILFSTRRSTVHSLPLQLGFPDWFNLKFVNKYCCVLICERYGAMALSIMTPSRTKIYPASSVLYWSAYINCFEQWRYAECCSTKCRGTNCTPTYKLFCFPNKPGFLVRLALIGFDGRPDEKILLWKIDENFFLINWISVNSFKSLQILGFKKFVSRL